MIAHANTKDQLVEQPAVGLFAYFTCQPVGWADNSSSSPEALRCPVEPNVQALGR